VYSRNATTCGSSSIAFCASACATKSASRSPLRPASRVPLGYSLSDAGSCKMYCSIDSASASPSARTSSSMAAVPIATPCRMCSSLTRM